MELPHMMRGPVVFEVTRYSFQLPGEDSDSIKSGFVSTPVHGVNSTMYYKERCLGPWLRSMICGRYVQFAKLGRKIVLSGPCLLFKQCSPQKNGAYLVSTSRVHWQLQVDRAKIIVGQDQRLHAGAMYTAVDPPWIAMNTVRTRACDCLPTFGSRNRPPFWWMDPILLALHSKEERSLESHCVLSHI